MCGDRITPHPKTVCLGASCSLHELHVCADVAVPATSACCRQCSYDTPPQYQRKGKDKIAYLCMYFLVPVSPSPLSLLPCHSSCSSTITFKPTWNSFDCSQVRSQRPSKTLSCSSARWDGNQKPVFIAYDHRHTKAEFYPWYGHV